ncbi:hypothetical protein [Streptomyces lasiicapitis]|uniref:hypothetical protein n=1 Tax=Streptomyces lasiicapitis TaxID=1923961 RepID=UPI00365CA848
MDEARLVLDYIKTLIWPLLLVAAAVFFREQVKALMGRLTVLRGGVAEIEFAELAAETRAETEAAAAELPLEDSELLLASASSDDSLRDLMNALRDSAQLAPGAAVVQGRAFLVRRLEAIADEFGIPRRTRGTLTAVNVRLVLDGLRSRGLPDSAARSVSQLLRLRNENVGPTGLPEITVPAALDYGVLIRRQGVPREHTWPPVTTTGLL